MNLIKKKRMTFLVLLFFNTTTFCQDSTVVEIAKVKGIDVSNIHIKKRNKSTLKLKDTAKLLCDFENDISFREFHLKHDSGYSYLSTININIENGKVQIIKYDQRNIFDSLILLLTKKYFMNYNWIYLKNTKRKNNKIDFNVLYDDDEKIIKFEINEFYKGKILSIFMRKIAFSFVDLPIANCNGNNF